jgi:ABC-type Fe3+ transport system substrate-binding protein
VVLIPSDGSVISGYTTIINKYAKNPNAAKLTREYIFSDRPDQPGARQRPSDPCRT